MIFKRYGVVNKKGRVISDSAFGMALKLTGNASASVGPKKFQGLLLYHFCRQRLRPYIVQTKF